MILYCSILNICWSEIKSWSLTIVKNVEFLDIGQVNPGKRFIVQKSIPLYLKVFKTGWLKYKKSYFYHRIYIVHKFRR